MIAAGAVAFLYCVGVSIVLTRVDPAPPESAKRDKPAAPEAPPRPPDRGSIYDAYEVCKDEIRSRLKAPSTASFVGRASQVVEDRGEGRYLVDGEVDAENSFGAHIRSRYVCGLQYEGEGRYTVLAARVE